MQQRRPRLGDILDDYCPRERRITNHAVVAMIDDEVKQTRCTTCDADHEYKEARIPPQRGGELRGWGSQASWLFADSRPMMITSRRGLAACARSADLRCPATAGG